MSPTRKKRKVMGGARKKRIKRRLWKEQGKRCAYCDITIPSKPGDPHNPEGILEHVIPISRGGVSNGSNLVLSCEVCDLLKRNNTWQVARGNPLLNQVLIRKGEENG